MYSFAKEDIRSATIFEELPIQIHNSDLVNCWLQEVVQKNESVANNSFERLDLATNAYLVGPVYEHISIASSGANFPM